MKNRLHITIQGIVQGVGFRPFIYNLARKCDLSGYVLNDTSGVSIDVEGSPASLEKFLEQVKTSPPPRAVIFEMHVDRHETLGYPDFTIKKSESDQEKFVPISPEIATCDDCLAELFDPGDRRHRYPFINCTNCGPRFTIIQDIPYDRKFTTMSPFTMCPQCQKEYDDPANRRFHAQPNACPKCGPRLELLDAEGRAIGVDDVIEETCRLLKQGKIMAIKGLGGYHLACDALNRDAVSQLRQRKYREYKPFALMVRDAATARRICLVNRDEEALLSGPIRPIVLLQKLPDTPVVDEVAPGQKYHGVMLPYAPLHHVVVAESGLILVMTSANISSEPIVFHDDEALQRLKGVADYYVVNNREIYIRTDDSVTRVWSGGEALMRRSRGYAPYPLLLSFETEGQILACGAELKNTFCLTRGNYAFMSHHIGDLENLETLTSFEQGIEHFKKLFYLEPSHIAYDLHPEYLSTKYALAMNSIPTIGVQHHHAHIVSCMVDNNISGEVIGVSFDGTGYGLDEKIWGGEFFACSFSSCRRLGHLEYAPLPGGERAIKEPWRIASCYLYNYYGNTMFDLGIPFTVSLDKKKWGTLQKMVERGVNSPLTSSSGRLFDAVSSLVIPRDEVYYEGQAAIEFEMAADIGEERAYTVDFADAGETTVIRPEPIFRGVVADLQHGVSAGIISARFHNTMAQLIVQMCQKIRASTGLKKVCLSGGVFQNALLLEKAFARLEGDGFIVFTHHRVPTNDGGIALGQAIIANELIKLGVVQAHGSR